MRSIYTVTQINTYIRNMFAQDFLLKTVTVAGEVSNCKYHSSGHIYFTLKDSNGAISCVMFRSSLRGLGFKLSDGQQVQVTGSIDVYERDGRYQLYAAKIEHAGTGQLYAQFLRLKEKLDEEGMFASEYKQPIPKYIRTLGVVTAPTGAAVRDIINIASRRNPYVQIILYPAVVQGDQAAASIVRGISAMEEQAADVIIVGRGGGSIEDLWAFNEESVAQAIFDCPIPIISAVGHETDITISDFVADLRAPTPSAAAELAVYEYRRFSEELTGFADSLQSLMIGRIDRNKAESGNLRHQLALCSPMGKLHDRQLRSDKLRDHMGSMMSVILTRYRHRLDIDIERMKACSPLDRLKSGYAYVTGADGRNIRNISQVNPGDNIHVRLEDGHLEATVTGKGSEI